MHTPAARDWGSFSAQGRGDIVAKRPIVIGIGSLLRGDDAIGVKIIEDLQCTIRILGAEAIDGGTGGLALAGYFRDRGEVIFIDSLDMGLKPGAVNVFSADAVSCPYESSCAGPVCELSDTLELVKEIAPEAKVMIVGIQPANNRPSLGLSPELQSRYSHICFHVRQALESELLETADA